MLTRFMVFARSGLVLFDDTVAFEIEEEKSDTDQVIHNFIISLLEKRSGSTTYDSDGYSIKYKVENKFGLVFICIYQAGYNPGYCEELLESATKAFTKLYKKEIEDASGPFDFKKKYEKLKWEAEEANRQKKGRKTPPAGQELDKKNVRNGDVDGTVGSDDNKGGDHDDDDDDDFGDDLMIKSLERKKEKGARKGPKTFQGKKKPKSPKSPAKGKGKEKRKWDGASLTKEEEEALNASGASLSAEEIEKAYLEKSKKYLPENMDEKADIDKDEDTDDDDDDDDENENGWFGSSKIGNFFAGLAGQKPLTKEEIAPVVEEMEKQLMSKNVATDAAKEICDAVATDLEGQKLGSFTKGIKSMVKESCHRALERLLTPKKSTDILREAKAISSQGRPYTIAFVGVNGVGKSTSLSKVAYYLKNNGLKVLLCACDTFRSGAVEQLRVHQKNLDVDIFEQGYNSDPANVARNGIKFGKENGFDVVLIDTAGRMQNNEPLMRALAKLVTLNTPDLVLFVGEALAGNDGRDQLVHFNRALIDYGGDDPRTIDGMILTKFDTIDDKVGSAVSMVHSTGQPIMFLGTGQKYTNLNRLNVSKVVKALLSN